MEAFIGQLYIFSSNRIEILLVLPENEPHQQNAVYSLVYSVLVARKKEL
jgi:hypothetical protein